MSRHHGLPVLAVAGAGAYIHTTYLRSEVVLVLVLVLVALRGPLDGLGREGAGLA